jgi:hypothetical protein
MQYIYLCILICYYAWWMVINIKDQFDCVYGWMITILNKACVSCLFSIFFLWGCNIHFHIQFSPSVTRGFLLNYVNVM